MSKKKLNQVTQTHGKEVKQEVTKPKPRTLDQVWGDTGHSKYHTLDIAVYEGQLREMNKSDLQSHAAAIGILPIDSREMLTKRLVREFKSHVGSFRAPADEVMPQKPISKEALAILAEGR